MSDQLTPAQIEFLAVWKDAKSMLSIVTGKSSPALKAEATKMLARLQSIISTKGFHVPEEAMHGLPNEIRDPVMSVLLVLFYQAVSK